MDYRVPHLFVGSLPRDITKSEFHDFFSQFGKVHTASLRFTREGFSRGFGFVTYMNPLVAKHVAKLGKNSNSYDSSSSSSSSSSKKDDRFVFSTGRLVMRGRLCKVKPDKKYSQCTENNEKNSKGRLFVDGLPPNISNPELIHLFQKFGKVDDAFVMVDNITGRTRGFGFVSMADPKVAQSLLMMKDNDWRNYTTTTTKDNSTVGRIVIGGVVIRTRIYNDNDDDDDDDDDMENTNQKEKQKREHSGNISTVTNSKRPVDYDEETLIDIDRPLTHKRVRRCLNNDSKEKHIDVPSSSSSSSSPPPSASSLSLVPVSPSATAAVAAAFTPYANDTDTDANASTNATTLWLPSEGKLVVHVRYAGNPTNSNILFNFFTNRFRYAYQCEPTAPMRFIVRKGGKLNQNDAFVVCSTEEDCDRLLSLKNRNFNGFDMNLTRYTTGTNMTTYHSNNNNNKIDASSLPSSSLSPKNKSEYATLLREHKQLQFRHDDTMKQNRQLEIECEDLQARLLYKEGSLSKHNKKHRDEWDQQQQQQQMMIESLQQQIVESDQQRNKLSNTISKQTTTIHNMVEEKQTILQRLDDEVMIRHQAENLFDEEKVELRTLLETKISNRCDIEQETETIHKQLPQEMKKRQTVEQEKYVLLYQQRKNNSHSTIPKKEE